MQYQKCTIDINFSFIFNKTLNKILGYMIMLLAKVT